jgi:hypothetical protein
METLLIFTLAREDRSLTYDLGFWCSPKDSGPLVLELKSKKSRVVGLCHK